MTGKPICYSVYYTHFDSHGVDTGCPQIKHPDKEKERRINELISNCVYGWLDCYIERGWAIPMFNRLNNDGSVADMDTHIVSDRILSIRMTFRDPYGINGENSSNVLYDYSCYIDLDEEREIVFTDIVDVSDAFINDVNASIYPINYQTYWHTDDEAISIWKEDFIRMNKTDLYDGCKYSAQDYINCFELDLSHKSAFFLSDKSLVYLLYNQTNGSSEYAVDYSDIYQYLKAPYKGVIY